MHVRADEKYLIALGCRELRILHHQAGFASTWPSRQQLNPKGTVRKETLEFGQVCGTSHEGVGQGFSTGCIRPQAFDTWIAPPLVPICEAKLLGGQESVTDDP